MVLLHSLLFLLFLLCPTVSVGRSAENRGTFRRKPWDDSGGIRGMLSVSTVASRRVIHRGIVDGLGRIDGYAGHQPQPVPDGATAATAGGGTPVGRDRADAKQRRDGALDRPDVCLAGRCRPAQRVHGQGLVPQTEPRLVVVVSADER